MTTWGRFIVRNRKPTLLLVAILTTGLAVAASQLSIETELEFDLDDSIPEVRNFNEIEDRFGGQITAQFLLEANDRRDLEDLEAALDEVDGLGFIDGPIHRLERMGQPNGSLLQDATADVVSGNWWRVIVGYEEDDEAVVDVLRDLVDDTPDARLTGQSIVQLESQSKVLDSLFLSTGIALALVLLLLLAVFRDVRYGTLAFLPLVMIIVWQLGIQAAIGIPLNPITGVIIAMTLGIGVDYSLHIVSHYKGQRHRGKKEATRRAVASVGRPVLAASMTTVFAFSVLGFSSLLPLQQFGYTAAIVITCAFIVSLTFLPALTSGRGTEAVAVGEPRVVEFRERPGQTITPRTPQSKR